MKRIIMKTDKTVVEFARYLRPTDKNGNDSNLGGVTFLFTVDYTLRLATVRFAICSANDNFDKKTGCDIAHQAVTRSFNLDKFQDYANRAGGFVNALVNVATVEELTGTATRDLLLLLKKLREQNLT